MADTFTTWRAADEQWTQRNRDVLEIVWRLFMETGKWPEVEDLQRLLHQSGVRSIDVRAVADSKPSVPGQLVPAFRPNIVLGSRHLLQLPAAHPMLSLVFRATKVAVRVYLTPGVKREEMVVVSSEPEFQPFPALVIERFPEFVFSDYPNAFAGGGYGADGFRLGVNIATVMNFENVATPEEYVQRQFDMIREWAAEQDMRQGITVPTGPARAFVVMPFDEPWSIESLDFIMGAVDAQGGAVEAIRADQIDKTGRITDQIVEELRSCDLVIADITGNNANVTWELGYAWAKEVPCVIIRQRDTGVAPFDIYDHRRIDYSVVPTGEQRERLAAMVRRAIGG